MSVFIIRAVLGGLVILLVATRQEWEFRIGHIKEALNFPISLE